jgi:hypothetical protein
MLNDFDYFYILIKLNSQINILVIKINILFIIIINMEYF